MSDSPLLIPILALVGGIALFLLGTELLVTGLQQAAGDRAREFLARLTSGRIRGAAAGMAASTAMHSGPTTIVVLGYVSAGIISLSQAIPLIFGANIGTTLSMQIAAFSMGKYCFALIAIGLLMKRMMRDGWASVGQAICGFGVLFLGLETMKTAIEPLRGTPLFESVIGLIQVQSAMTFSMSLLAGIAITVIFQSSGVIVSLLFSLAALGLVDDYRLAVPFILGAHIGTCSMTLIAAVGGSAVVWRAAFSHLAFNVLGAVAAIAMLPLYDLLIPRTSTDLVRQVANFNTIKQVMSVILFLPFTPLFEKFIVAATRHWGGVDEERSHLDPAFIEKPESAILAVTRELQRQARLVDEMLRLALDGLVSLDMQRFQPVTVKEQAVDLIRYQIQGYISRVAERSLVPRQGLMLQRLILTSNAIERIGDHVEDIGYLCRTKIRNDIWFPDEHMHQLLGLSNLVREMLRTSLKGLDPTVPESHEMGVHVLEQRAEYKRRSKLLKDAVKDSFSEHEEVASKLFFLRYVLILDKIVSHLKTMARQESQDSWTVDEIELERVEPLVPKSPGRPPAHPQHGSFEEAIKDLQP